MVWGSIHKYVKKFFVRKIVQSCSFMLSSFSSSRCICHPPPPPQRLLSQLPPPLIGLEAMISSFYASHVQVIELSSGSCHALAVHSTPLPQAEFLNSLPPLPLASFEIGLRLNATTEDGDNGAPNVTAAQHGFQSLPRVQIVEHFTKLIFLWWQSAGHLLLLELES